jgi:hypothetical protein
MRPTNAPQRVIEAPLKTLLVFPVRIFERFELAPGNPARKNFLRLPSASLTAERALVYFAHGFRLMAHGTVAIFFRVRLRLNGDGRELLPFVGNDSEKPLFDGIVDHAAPNFPLWPKCRSIQYSSSS